MPRRAAAQIRPVEPDPVHRSRLVQQVINRVMLDGKKSKAEALVYDALAILGERTGKDPIEQLEVSIKALTPQLEVRSRRVGGATYQVPVEVPPRRARPLAVRARAPRGPPPRARPPPPPRSGGAPPPAPREDHVPAARQRAARRAVPAG